MSLPMVERRTWTDAGGAKHQGLPFTEHFVIDKHGNVQKIQADRHQRDWQMFELDRGAIIVNEEPLGPADLKDRHGRMAQVSMETVLERLDGYKGEIEKRRKENLAQIEANRGVAPKVRAKREAAAEMVEFMNQFRQQTNGVTMPAELLAEIKAMREDNARMRAELAELKAAQPEPKKK